MTCSRKQEHPKAREVTREGPKRFLSAASGCSEASTAASAYMLETGTAPVLVDVLFLTPLTRLQAGHCMCGGFVVCVYRVRLVPPKAKQDR